MIYDSHNARRLRGVPISGTAPTDGQALVYQASSGLWLPGSAAPAANLIQYATVAISSAQIKALGVTPVTLVAAQGAGTYVELVSALFNIVAGTLYANGSGGAPSFQLAYGSYNNFALSIDTGNGNGLVFGLKTNLGGNLAIYYGPPAVSSTGVSGGGGILADVAGGAQNQPLVLCNVGTANHDLVTGTGTISARIAYRVHSGLS